MSIAEQVRSETDYIKHGSGMGCKVGQLLKVLPKEEGEALQSMFQTPGVHSRRYIYEVLQREGHPIGDSSIRHHRAGSCTCK